MRLVLVRHGETDLNRQGRVQGLNAHPLNALGRAQAGAIAEAVAADMPFDLYASPVPRALETASVVAGRLGVSVTRLDPVREADAGELVGLTGGGDEAPLSRLHGALGRRRRDRQDARR